MFGGGIARIPGGVRVSCGPSQEVRVLSPKAVMEIDPTFDAGPVSPVLAGICVVSDTRRGVTPASEGCGTFIEWAS
jgi:hypothetical protein